MLFRFPTLKIGIDLPWLLDIADDLDDGSYWEPDEDDNDGRDNSWQTELANRYPGGNAERIHNEG